MAESGIKTIMCTKKKSGERNKCYDDSEKILTMCISISHTCVHTHTHMHTRTHTHLCTHKHTHERTYVYMYTHMCTHRCTHTQACTHSRTHACTHTHTQKREKKLTWIILVMTGQEAAMMTHDPLSPSVIGHHSVLHWTACTHSHHPTMAHMPRGLFLLCFIFKVTCLAFPSAFAKSLGINRQGS